MYLLIFPLSRSIDGAGLPPPYDRPGYTGPEIIPESNEKLYTGSCHCGAITLAVRTKALSQVEVRECDCTICTTVRRTHLHEDEALLTSYQNAYVLFYPNISKLGISEAKPGVMSTYQFARKFLEHKFCSVCGVSTHIKTIGPPKEIVDKMSEVALEHRRKMLEISPVNLRVLNDVEWNELKISDSEGPPREA